MKAITSLAALSCVLFGSVEATGPYKWSQDKHVRNWQPAKETPDFGVLPQLGIWNAHPEPTAAPVLDDAVLRKRSSTDNTCAYVSGSSGRHSSQLQDAVSRHSWC